MNKELLLPPAVRDIIDAINRPKADSQYQENLLERLEVIEQACRKTIDEFRMKRRVR